jgi:hypothetical protein
MRWAIASLALTAAALGAAGCGQLGVGPHPADSAPTAVAAEPTALPDFRAQAGKTYAQFVQQPGMERYALDAFGLSEAERARFAHAMASEAPGLLASGGGAEALVFSGCAPSGCLEGLSVVAIDVATGETFVGVSDAGGAVELAPNDRLEALLRLTSPSQTWDDPVRPRAAPG